MKRFRRRTSTKPSWRFGLLERFVRLFRGQSSGATYVEYILLVGFCALGLIGAYKRFRANVAVSARNEAKIVATLDAEYPEQALADLGGFDSVDDECDPTVGCLIPGVECFGAGTVVATETGDRAIETVSVGELVWSRDEDTQITDLRAVTRVFVSRAPAVVEVELQNGLETELLTVTPDHPFWVVDRGWTPAHALSEVPLWSPDSSLSASAVANGSGPTTVYNLEVEGFHTYFVGKAHALVHNACEVDPIKDCYQPVLALPHTSYKRRKAELLELCKSKKYVFNKSTKRLRDVTRGEPRKPPDKRPCYKQQKDRIDSPVPVDSELQADLNERAQLLCDKKSTEAGQISGRIGEQAASNWGRNEFPASEGWTETIYPTAPHVFDIIYVRGDEVVIVEAKGGDAGLGTRYKYGSNEDTVQQGTLDYAETIAKEMVDNPARQDDGEAILRAIRDRKVKYYSVQQRLEKPDCGPPPKGTLGNVEIGEFAIYPDEREGNDLCNGKG